eukprot:193500_1
MSKKPKTKLLIAGYIRSNQQSLLMHKNADFGVIPTEISEIIKMFYFYDKYMDIIICEKRMDDLGENIKHKIKMPNNGMFGFTELQCPKCCKIDKNGILLFITSYEQEIPNQPQKFSHKLNISGFYNKANEYQCKLRNYYIIHIVKINLVRNYGDDRLEITPFLNDENDLEKIRKSDIMNGNCYECGNKTIRLNYAYCEAGLGADTFITTFCAHCALTHNYHEYDTW